MAEPFDPAPERGGAPRPFGVSPRRGGMPDVSDPVDPHFERSDQGAGPMGRHAAEWGLAALLGGGFLMVTAAVILVLNMTLWNAGPGVLSTGDTHLALAAAMIGVPAMIGLCIANVVIGGRAIHSALVRGQPAGLALAGTMIGAGALLLWIISGADLLMILVSFAR